MHAPQEETLTSGSNHMAGVNTENTGEIIADEVSQYQHLAALTARAELLSHQLRQVHSGYVLSRGSQSWHFSDLKTADELLKR